MEHLKHLLSKTFQSTWKIKLLTDWPDIMGSLASQVSIERIYENELILGVTSACWLQELYSLSPLLIKTINERLEIPRIKTLRFKQCTKEEKPTVLQTHDSEPIVTKKYMLKQHETRALNQIEEEGLKNALHDFLQRCQHKIRD